MSVKGINLRNRYLGRTVNIYDNDSYWIGFGTIRRSHATTGYGKWVGSIFGGKDFAFTNFFAGDVPLRRNDIVVLLPKDKRVVKTVGDLTEADAGRRVRLTDSDIRWEGVLASHGPNNTGYNRFYLTDAIAGWEDKIPAWRVEIFDDEGVKFV